MKSSRLKYTLINSTILSVIQLLTILLKFITQTVFIRTLGKDFLGLNGLFTNIISVLSFAELGIGTAIVFSLYEPLANGNEKKVAALMYLFKRAYTFIGITVAVVGMALLPFLHFLIKDYDQLNNVAYYFILYLSNSVVSYFFSYKRSLLIADQHEYISALNIFGFMVIQVIVQIIMLIFFHAYSLYLWTAVICTFVSNLFISKKVNDIYPYLKKFGHVKIENNLKKVIKSNVIGMIGSKIGSIVVRSTDNLLISMFLGIAIVGLYSNYLLIVTSISTILIKLVSSVTATIGNLATEHDAQKSYEVFTKHFMINLFVTTIASACLLVSLTPFIGFWAGKGYALGFNIVIAIVLNFFIDQIRQTSITFISAYGLFVPNGKKSVIEAFMNLALSVIFMKMLHLGIVGTLTGTICTNIFLNSWWEPLLVLNRGFRLKNIFLIFYVKLYLKNTAFLLFAVSLFAWLIFELDRYLNMSGILAAVVNSVIMIIMLVLLILTTYRHNDSLRYVKRILKSLI